MQVLIPQLRRLARTMGIVSNWKKARTSRANLDYLLSSIHADRPIRDRLDWFRDLLHWLNTPSTARNPQLDFTSGQGQMARLRYLLQVLQRNEQWRSQVAKTLRSIIRDTEAIDLFTGTGIPSSIGMASEFSERLFTQILPHPPREKDLGELLPLWFPNPADSAWLEKLEEAHYEQLLELLHFDEQESEAGWNTMIRDMEDSILLLSTNIRTKGLSSELRKRFSSHRLRELPFYDLSYTARGFIASRYIQDENIKQDRFDAFRSTLEKCQKEIVYAQEHLQEYGISIGLVYQLERMRAEIRRASTLASLLNRNLIPKAVIRFLAYLVVKSAANRSIRALLRENVAVLSKRIVARNAAVGENYITRSVGDYLIMFKKAAGCGIVTAPIAIAKGLTEGLGASLFFKGVITSFNYSTLFVVIHAFGLALATKQPAMTAPALAKSIPDDEEERSLEPLLDEITNIIRSQVATVIGNVALVVPSVILLHTIIGGGVLSQPEALNLIDKYSFFGPTFFYAAFTGFLLWLSSLIAGVIDNWMAYRQIPESIAANRMLNLTFNPKTVEKASNLIHNHLPAIGGSIALGLLLGMSPQIFGFLGIAVEIRHVTISSGLITLALLDGGWQQLSSLDVGMLVVTLLGVGVCNVLVSFALALSVAIGSKKMTNEEHGPHVYRELFKRFLRKPWSFFLPIGITDKK